MLLALDIGNTQINIGVFEGKKLKATSRIATIAASTGDQYAVELKSILELNGCDYRTVTGSVISSVVPSVGANMKEAVKRITGKEPLFLGPGVKTGLNIKVENPAQLGSDLVAGAVAVIAAYTLPAIIFDFGTATKISVIDKDGSFLGCAITAGINISIDALSEKTAALPKITACLPKNVIGVNSVESMKSGLIFGSAALIDGMSARIENELGQKATLIITGGLAGMVVGLSSRKIVYNDNLLLDGLRIIHEKNV